MSVEIISDLIEEIKTGEKDKFSSVLESILYYGIADDMQLSNLFNLDGADLEELFEDSSTLDDPTYKSYKSKLVKFLKKESSAYDHLYYSDE